MPPAARGGRYGGGRGGRGGRGDGGGGGIARGQQACACEANMPLLAELRKLDGECLRTGKQNLRHGVMRAIRSVKLYPLPITTEAEARELEGIGSFTARRMLMGLTVVHASHQNTSARTSGSASCGGNGEEHNRENVAPYNAPSSLALLSRADRQKQTRSHGNQEQQQGRSGMLSAEQNSQISRDSDRDHSHGLAGSYPQSSHNDGTAAVQSGSHRRVVIPGATRSLAANVSAIRDADDSGAASAGGVLTPDVTPRRPTSRARREQEDMDVRVDSDHRREKDRPGGGPAIVSSLEPEKEAPRVFSGCWEAILIVDNREHDYLSVQSALLQKGIPCETRQLPLGDMLWVGRRKDSPAPEVLLGYIVERKTAPDLASSIMDGRYNEQKRRLKLSGLRRRIYLVEGNLSHQGQLAPAALRTALATSQACGGLAVVHTDSLRDTLDFLARTHRHISSLLKRSCAPAEASLQTSSFGDLSSGALFGTGSATSSHQTENAAGSGNVNTGERNRSFIRACGGSSGVGAWLRSESHSGASLLRPAMTYDEYTSRCAKNAAAVTVRHILGAMMRQAPGCSATRAEAIATAFGSPLGFLLALEEAGHGDRMEKGGGACAYESTELEMKRGEEMLGELRCSGGAGTNKLPQPLRRMLCRLFMGDSILAVQGGAGIGARIGGAQVEHGSVA